MTLTGFNIRPTLTVALADESKRALQVAVASDGTASFVTPSDLTPGQLKLVATQDGLEQPISLYFEPGKSDYPIFTGDASQFPNGQKFYDANGLLQLGTKTPELGVSKPLCTMDGQVGCETSNDFKAASMVNVSPGNIKSGVTLGGVVGSYAASSTSLPNCASDGASQCVVDGTTYKAASISVLSAGNIKSGVTIGGVLGTLATASNAPNCNADGGAGCVVDGTTYKAAKLSNFSASDFRSGVTVAGVSGSLANCSASGATGCMVVGPTYKAATDCAADGAGSCFVDGTTYKALKPASISASGLLSSVTLLGVTGSIANCASDGSSACYVPSYVLTTQPYRAVNYDNINSNIAKVRTGVTFAGLAGTLADCSGNAATGCVTTATYKSADLTNLAAANIRRGVGIAGTTGTFPSSTAPLPLWTDGSTTATTTSTGEVDFTNFITQLTSAGTFQYWDSTGQRRTGSGDANIVAANVKTGVTFANVNVTGSFQGTAPDAWDVRAGVTVGGVAGKLKINCRNSINNSYYNWDGAVSSLPDTASTSGTTFDYWDTIDDYFGQPSSTGFPAAWSVASNYCGGTTTTATDDKVWLDTTIGTCATNGSNCRYKDKISGLEWSKYTGATTYTWSAAVRYCANLTHDGQTGWRLPTQKELVAAYTHGITSLAGTNWATLAQMQGYVWSASTYASNTTIAWIVNLALGSVTATTKTTTFPAVCVR